MSFYAQSPAASSAAPSRPLADLVRSAAVEDFQVILRPEPCQPSSSAAAAQPLRGPTKSELSGLTALPSAMLSVQTMAGRRRKPKGGRAKLAKEGQIVSVMYDCLGKRPYPRNGISLEQSIQLEMTALYTQAWLVSGTIVGANNYASAYFALSGFAGAASLVTVFDQYRIDQIEVWIECNNPNSAAVMPDLVSAIDLDDATAPTAVGQVADKPGALFGVGPGGHYHKWKPHMAIAAYSGAFTSYSNWPAGWIDVASPNVQHYGLKAATTANGTGAIGFNLVARAVISFRSPAIN